MNHLSAKILMRKSFFVAEGGPIDFESVLFVLPKIRED